MPEATFGGVPPWLLAAYLEELGGAPGDEGTFQGDGWTARLRSHARGPDALAPGRVTVVLTGPRAAQALEALRKKAMRGGG